MSTQPSTSDAPAVPLHPVVAAEATTIVPTYSRPPFVLARGEGVWLYDTDGRAYLDMVAGIAVNALGYGDAEVTAAIQRAATGLLHTSNLFHTEPQVALAQLLVAHSFADRVFFCNSGTEANEAALKFARKLAYNADDHDRTEVVCFTGAFHGRTMGALAVTPREKYQKPFGPMLPGVRVAAYNDLDSARDAISARTLAVIVEPVQGEGGVNPASVGFLRGLRALCDDHGALLIFDQVQCGMGRTGTLFSHEPSGIQPDMLTLAKPLAAGLPIGAVLATERVATAIQPGDHGSTFAGGPLVTSVAQVVLRRISDPAFLAHVRDVGGYLLESLSTLDSPHVVQVRGRGLMAAVEFDVDVAPIVTAGYDHGLLLVNAGPKVLRFVPPLVLQRADVDEAMRRLNATLRAVGLS